jgi:hypothetical protein
VICLDVVINQADRDGYEELVGQLLVAAGCALLVSGYEGGGRRPAMVHFHERLSDTVRRLRPDVQLGRLRDHHEITTWLVTGPAERESRP